MHSNNFFNETTYKCVAKTLLLNKNFVKHVKTIAKFILLIICFIFLLHHEDHLSKISFN